MAIPKVIDEDETPLDLSSIHMRLMARNIQPRNLFRRCPPIINFKEFIERIRDANIIVDHTMENRLQKKFDTGKGVEWELFVEEVENSKTLINEIGNESDVGIPAVRPKKFPYVRRRGYPI